MSFDRPLAVTAWNGNSYCSRIVPASDSETKFADGLASDAIQRTGPQKLFVTMTGIKSTTW